MSTSELLALARASEASDTEALEDLADAALERCEGREAAAGVEALLREPGAAARALPGALIACAIEWADGEIQGCGGQVEWREWLEALVRGVDAGAVLRRQLADPAPLVRQSALVGIGAILRGQAEYGLKGSLSPWAGDWEALALAAAGDGEPSVRAQALAALAALAARGPAALAAIVGARADPAPAVRAAAVAASALLGERAHERLEALLEDPDEAAAEAAVLRLVEARSGRVAGALRDRLERGVAPEQTCRLVRRAGLPAFPGALLARYLGPEQPDGVRRQAAQALVEWVEPGCRPALRTALAGGDIPATFAAMALSRCPDPAAGPALVEAMCGPSPALDPRWSAGTLLRDAAALALGVIGDEAAVAALSAVPVRERRDGEGIAEPLLGVALGLTGRREAGPRLAALARTPNLYARRLVAVSLGCCGVEGARRDLRRWMLRPHKGDRVLAPHAALGLLLLSPDRPGAEVLGVLRANKAPRVATFEGEALAGAVGLRAAGRLASAGRLHQEARAACLSWARAFAPGVQQALDCYRERGHAISLSSAWCLLVRDLVAEAEVGLRTGSR